MGPSRAHRALSRQAEFENPYILLVEKKVSSLQSLLPLLEHLDARSNEPQALIVCPSRELAFQTARVADLYTVFGEHESVKTRSGKCISPVVCRSRNTLNPSFLTIFGIVDHILRSR